MSGTVEYAMGIEVDDGMTIIHETTKIASQWAFDKDGILKVRDATEYGWSRWENPTRVTRTLLLAIGFTHKNDTHLKRDVLQPGEFLPGYHGTASPRVGGE